MGKIWTTLKYATNLFFHETEADKFFKSLFDPSKEVTDFHIINDEMINILHGKTKVTWLKKIIRQTYLLRHLLPVGLG